MALRALRDHPKFRRLSRVLGSDYVAMGVLELVYHFTARFTPSGNIGKYSDEEIETWIGWDGEDGAAVAALVKCGLIDTDEHHRLVVHDWHQWADSEVHATLAKQTERFANGDMPKLEKTKFGGPVRNRIRAAYRGVEPEEGDSVPQTSPNLGDGGGTMSAPGQSQSQSQSQSRIRAGARDGGTDGPEKTPKRRQDLTPPETPGNDPPDLEQGRALWEPFSKVQQFSLGSTDAQIEGLQDVYETYKTHGLEQLVKLAQRCARHYAPNKVVLGNIKSAANALENWITTEMKITSRDTEKNTDGYQSV